MVLKGSENFWGLASIRVNLAPVSTRAVTLSLFLDNQLNMRTSLPPMTLTWRSSWPSSWTRDREAPTKEQTVSLRPLLENIGQQGWLGQSEQVWTIVQVLMFSICSQHSIVPCLFLRWGSGQQWGQTIFASGLLLPSPLQPFFSLATFWFSLN